MIRKIAHFDVFELIGQGGMGTVYRALDPVIGRTVAIKTIRLTGYHDEEEASYLRECLFKEARAAGSLSHPGIATVFQAGLHDDLAFIAMEFIDGATLKDRLASSRPKSYRELIPILRDTGAALDYAHERGIIHRDVKPSNIMCTVGGLTKVTDFGIAKTMLIETKTHDGMLLGTPFYMSPEYIQGKKLDGRSDQFSLAVIAYEMLTGHKPFTGDDATSVFVQIVHGEPFCPSQLGCNLPAHAFEILKRGLEKEPSKRFSSCEEFAAALTDAMERNVDGMARTLGASDTVGVSDRKARRRKGGIPGAILGIGLVIGCMLLLQPRSEQVAPGSVSRASAPAVVLHESVEPTAVPPPKVKSTREPEVRKERRTAALTPAVEATPEVMPRNVEDSTGYAIWRGSLTKGEVLTIVDNRASTGTLSGLIPSYAPGVEIYPAIENGRLATVFTTDPRYSVPVTLRRYETKLYLTWDPRHANDLTVWERPQVSNDGRRLSMRVNIGLLSACVIRWKERADSRMRAPGGSY